MPVTTTIRDDKGTEQSVTVAQDEGIRPGTTMEGLAKLKPAFKNGGSTTAGETGLGVAEEGAALAGCSPLGAGATRQVDGEGVDPLSLPPRPPQPCALPPGNSSQVSDGAAAILLARRSKAEELGLPILGVLRSYAVVGVPPDIMGIGPAYAIPVALQKAGKTAPSPPRFRPSSCCSCCRLRQVGDRSLGWACGCLQRAGG